MEAEVSVSRLTNKLQALLSGQATTLSGRFEKQVHTTIINLNASKKILKDVHVFDEAIMNDERIIQLLERVYSTEDAIHDIFLMKKENYIPWCLRFFTCNMKSLYSVIVFTHKMKKLEKQLGCLVEIFMREEASSSNIRSNDNNNTQLLELSPQQLWGGSAADFCLEEETHVVGIQEQVNDLVLQLIPQVVNHNEAGQSNGIIAVTGKAGSGKTTLVRSVYNRVDVKRHFRQRAWVRIPSVFKTKDVVADIYKQINQAEFVMEATLDEDELIRKLTRSLEGSCRYLIVLEDVNTPQVWESLQGVLSCSSQSGNKVIIIARNTSILPPNAAHWTLRMPELEAEESWELFSKKVRIDEDELNKSPHELVRLKEHILKICCGLPLLVVLLGGLLSTKEQSYGEWSRVLTILSDKTSEDIMALCYQDLPTEVKPCFLYMRIFPRGFEIPVRRLINLWSAEGFVTPSNPNNPAEKYLEELLTRNMVQARWRLDGTPKTCYMPSALYDFFSSKAVHIGLCPHRTKLCHTFAVRRLVAYAGMINYFLSPFRNLQFILAFDTRLRISSARDIHMLLNKITSNRGFEMLTVLDLEGVFQPKLSDNVVKKLMSLSYLGLRLTFMDYLPDAVECLRFLETLDVKHTNIGSVKLPNTNRLQHIYLNRNHGEIFVEENNAANLRTLRGLNISGILEDNFNGLFNMRELTNLGLTFCTATYNLNRIAQWINDQTELQSLKLRSIDNDGRHSKIKLCSMAQHQKLHELYLLGKLSQSVIDIGFLPPNLRKLTLSLSGLEKDPMPVLGQLPHLNILRLYSGSYKRKEMTCSSRGFPELRQLKLWKLQVRLWTMGKGAMPCLRELEIRSCENIEMPQELKKIATLKEIALTNMPTTYVAAVEEWLKNRAVYIQKNTWDSHPFQEQV